MIEQKIKLPNGVHIHVAHSNNAKPAVLFLHFSGGTHQMWNGVLPYFQDDFRIIAPDFRGHGESDKPTTGYHIEDYAQDIYLLLQELGVHHCHIVGSSMGAEVGLSLAASHPDIVQSFVCEGALYNEFGEFGLYDGTDQQIQQLKADKTRQLAERKVPLCTTRTEYLELAKIPFVEEGLWNEYFARYLESTVMKTDEGLYTSHYQNYVRTEYIQKYWELRFEDYYQNVQCPVLFLPSEEEWANERIRHSLHYFAKSLTSFQIKHIPNGHHAYVWMQYPNIVADLIKAFIQSHII